MKLNATKVVLDALLKEEPNPYVQDGFLLFNEIKIETSLDEKPVVVFKLLKDGVVLVTGKGGHVGDDIDFIIHEGKMSIFLEPG